MAKRVTISDDVLSDYGDGATLDQLAIKYGCSASSISRYLKKAGVIVRPRGRKKGVDYSNSTKTQGDEATASSETPLPETLPEPASIGVDPAFVKEEGGFEEEAPRFNVLR